MHRRPARGGQRALVSAAPRGYRFKGTATVHERDDDVYRRGLELLRERDYGAYEEQVDAIVLIRVDAAAPLTSPAYDLPETREDDVRAHGRAYYSGL